MAKIAGFAKNPQFPPIIVLLRKYILKEEVSNEKIEEASDAFRPCWPSDRSSDNWGGGTLAYLTDTETADNTFTVGKVKIALSEPNYPGNDSAAVKNLVPNEVVDKDPQVKNTGINDAIIYLKVEIPKADVTLVNEGGARDEKKAQEIFSMKGLRTGDDGTWLELRRDDTAEDKCTYVFAYKTKLSKDATTEALFDQVQLKNVLEREIDETVQDIKIYAYAIQSDNILDVDTTTLDKTTLDKVYDIYVNQSGFKDNQEEAPVLGTITYDLDGGTMDESEVTYTKNDYSKSMQSVISKKPTKEGCVFKGWEPAYIDPDTTGNITAKAVWVNEGDVLGQIIFDFGDGEGEPLRTFYTSEDYDKYFDWFFDVSGRPHKDGYYSAGFDPEELEYGTTGDITVKAQYTSYSTLVSGKEFNAKVKALGGENAHMAVALPDPDTGEFPDLDLFPGEEQMTEANIVSLPGEKFKTYIWNEENIIHIHSMADCLRFTETAYMYDGLFTDVSLDATSFEATPNSQYYFRNCTGLQENIGLLFAEDAKNINLEGTFEGCTNMTSVTIENCGTGSIKNARNLFKGCVNLEDIRFGDYDPIDIANGADTTDMFNLKGDSTVERTAGNTLTIHGASESFKKVAQESNLGLEGVQLVFSNY